MKTTNVKRFHRQEEVVTCTMLDEPRITFSLPSLPEVQHIELVNAFLRVAESNELDSHVKVKKDCVVLGFMHASDEYGLSFKHPANDSQGRFLFTLGSGDEDESITLEFLAFVGDAIQLAYGANVQKIKGKAKLMELEATFCVDDVDLSDYSFERSDGGSVVVQDMTRGKRRKTAVSENVAKQPTPDSPVSNEAIKVRHDEFNGLAIVCQATWPHGADLGELFNVASALRVVQRENVQGPKTSSQENGAATWWKPEVEWERLVKHLNASGLFTLTPALRVNQTRR